MNDVNLTLSAEEAQALYALLKDELPDLNYEVARTDNQDLRHWLGDRRDRIAHISHQLEPAVQRAEAEAAPVKGVEP